MKNNYTLEDVDFAKKTISLDANIEILDRLPEIINKPSLTEEETKVYNNLWKMIEFVCGGRYTADFIIMYQVLDQGNSQREVAEMLGVSHMAINKRYKKVVNKLKFLMGLDTDIIPYRKDSGPQEKLG